MQFKEIVDGKTVKQTVKTNKNHPHGETVDYQ